MSIASSEIRIIEPTGMLITTTAAELSSQVKAFMKEGIKVVLVDLKNVKFIDSSGLGTLVSLHTQLRLAGARLCLCSPNDQAQGILDISDLDRIIEIFPNRIEFYAAMSKMQAIH